MRLNCFVFVVVVFKANDALARFSYIANVSQNACEGYSLRVEYCMASSGKRSGSQVR